MGIFIECLILIGVFGIPPSLQLVCICDNTMSMWIVLSECVWVRVCVRLYNYFHILSCVRFRLYVRVLDKF